MGRPEGSKNKRPQHKWSDEEKAYIREITPGRHYHEILELMNDKFEYDFNLEQIKGAMRRYKLVTGFTGRFEKGSVPYNKGTKGLTGPNKTSFKKGNIPQNYRPVGSERINSEGYIEVKIADPRKWEYKHILIWEKHNGKVAKGHAVMFADGNKLNLDISNLRLVTRKQLLFLNNKGLIKDNAELTDAGINIADVLIKIGDVKRKK